MPRAVDENRLDLVRRFEGLRADYCQVTARSGRRLRGGPGLEHEVLRLLPFGTRLYVERQVDGWSAADLEGDDAVDGYVYSAFLKQADS
jgi:hypothetical protein